MFRQIVVPLDGSASSERALWTAGAVAERTGAQLHIVRVQIPAFGMIDGMDLTALDMRARQQAEEHLHRVAETLQRERGIAARTVMLEGPPAATICQAATDADADLIVMTTHGLTGFNRLWLGSVADAVVRHATTPVLLLRAVPPAESQHPQGILFSNVLISLDGSPASESIIPPAVALGRLAHADYGLVRAISPVVLASAVSPFGEIAISADQAAMDAALHQSEMYLDSIAERIRCEQRGTTVSTFVKPIETAAHAILTCAAEWGADLIAISTHGRGMTRHLIGSVADKVIRGAEVPVLVGRINR
jgi:nucleotide-binding universal stress UspA family protein